MSAVLTLENRQLPMHVDYPPFYKSQSQYNYYNMNQLNPYPKQIPWSIDGNENIYENDFGMENRHSHWSGMSCLLCLVFLMEYLDTVEVLLSAVKSDAFLDKISNPITH